MKTLKTWQKSGLIAAGFFVLLEAVLRVLSRAWWYQETGWYQGLIAINYPAGELSRVLLNWFHVPRIYDVPLGLRETLIINLTWFGLSAIWWFCLGAGVSVAWLWLTRRFRRESLV
jgi:hypothetical protein